MILPRLETPTEPVSRHASPRGERQPSRRKSGVEIRCQFIILARKDEPTPDYARKDELARKDALTPEFPDSAFPKTDRSAVAVVKRTV